MSEIKQDVLPVEDSSDKFIGVVDRSKLTTDIILSISNELDGSK